MSSTTGFDGKTYVKTFCITLSTSQSSDNNYYGDYNQDVYNISKIFKKTWSNIGLL